MNYYIGNTYCKISVWWCLCKVYLVNHCIVHIKYFTSIGFESPLLGSWTQSSCVCHYERLNERNKFCISNVLVDEKLWRHWTCDCFLRKLHVIREYSSNHNQIELQSWNHGTAINLKLNSYRRHRRSWDNTVQTVSICSVHLWLKISWCDLMLTKIIIWSLKWILNWIRWRRVNKYRVPCYSWSIKYNLVNFYVSVIFNPLKWSNRRCLCIYIGYKHDWK